MRARPISHVNSVTDVFRALLDLPIDAFPDISPTQVKIIIKSPGMTPEEVESLITQPVEVELLGIPFQSMLRSISKYALSSITIDFEDGTDIYWARQQVTERLNSVWGNLPIGISGGLAPMSTPLGDMFMFTVDNDALTLEEKRFLLDWTIRPASQATSQASGPVIAMRSTFSCARAAVDDSSAARPRAAMGSDVSCVAQSKQPSRKASTCPRLVAR